MKIAIIMHCYDFIAFPLCGVIAQANFDKLLSRNFEMFLSKYISFILGHQKILHSVEKGNKHIEFFFAQLQVIEIRLTLNWHIYRKLKIWRIYSLNTKNLYMHKLVKSWKFITNSIFSLLKINNFIINLGIIIRY